MMEKHLQEISARLSLLQDKMDEQECALATALEKREQMDKLRYFAEWCFSAVGTRPKMADFALAAARMYLEQWHAPEEIDVYMATCKLNATRGNG